MIDKCVICKREYYYDNIAIHNHVCDECNEESTWKTYTVILPTKGYYEWTGIAESEEAALEKARWEIESDYEPQYVETEGGETKITKVESDNFIMEYLEFIERTKNEVV